MRTYEIKVYDGSGMLIHKEYKYLEDNQAAQIATEDMEAEYSAMFSEWERIR